MAHTEAALVSVSPPYSPSLLLLLLVSFFIPPCASSLILSPRVFHPSSSVVKATPPAWRWTGRPKVFHVCHKVSYTHTHAHLSSLAGSVLCLSGTKQAKAIYQQLDLLEQIDRCPYIGSSIPLEKRKQDLSSTGKRGGCLGWWNVMCVMIEDCGIHTHRHTQKDTIHKLCFVYWGESLGAVTVEGIPVLGTACLMRSIGADCIIGGEKNPL